jgi:predicted Zn-dependent protease with MMP-like domain
VEREHFIQLVEEVVKSLPTEFREQIHNLAVLVKGRPSSRGKPRGPARQDRPPQAP